MKKYLSLVLALILALTAVSVALADEPVTLRMATGYNNAKTGLFFDPETAGEGVDIQNFPDEVKTLTKFGFHTLGIDLVDIHTAAGHDTLIDIFQRHKGERESFHFFNQVQTLCLA